MTAVKTKRISTLIESQLPEFISSEYELFAKFVQKYYEAQEVQGGTLDIISNIQKYADIDYYEKNLLKQNDVLSADITSTDTTITVSDASSFPSKNGYIRIGDEIIFYTSRTDTEFRDCARGVSGNTTLGDLYTESNFNSTESAPHTSGEKVFNVSNLFLYAFVKNFENQYLGSFPEKYLRGEVDKRTLIKNINKFYKAKGTDSSIKFIFNTIISQDIRNKPEVYNPKDFTYKASKSDWINVYALKAKVISGNPRDLIGKKVIQQETSNYGYVSAIVDNVKPEGTIDGEQIWNIILAPETVTGNFAISTKTTLTSSLSNNAGVGKRVNVFSTVGWEKSGEILIGEETIKFSEKNVSQFVIERRGNVTYTHNVGSSVYKPVIISGSGVSLLTLGVVYNFEIESPQPYSYSGDRVQVSNPGFETSDTKIVKTGTNESRWILNQNLPVNSAVSRVESDLDEVSTDISAIFEDDQYYYITTSGYPSSEILNGSEVIDEVVKDQKLLRIIRKQSTRTTEKYQTPKSEVGILLNGVRVYGYRDADSIRFGSLDRIQVINQGSGYARPPFVLLDGAPNKVRAVLSGSVVEKYIIDTDDTFPRTPIIDVTSGRGAKVRAVVTGDKITSLVIEDAGEYYSSPPLVRITDSNGKGRFAEYTSIVDNNGRITGFEKISEGSFYDQRTVNVQIIPVGVGAEATAVLKEWNFNRFEKLKSNLDQNYGHLFANYNTDFQYGYGQVGNPKSLRVELGDNLGSSGLEPTTKTHSPIIGFAYDGNPIYGPFGYGDPLDENSVIERMTSSYSRLNNRPGGPSTAKYPLGSFINDYVYTHKSGSLDENNGRYCVTPDFPEGTYAYFLTIDQNQVPQFPYFIGENFYSLPVDSNYNSNINQNDIPKSSRRYYVAGMPRNGDGLLAQIDEVKSGTVDSIVVESSSNNFSVNSKLYFDNTGSEGFGAEALVNSVKGKDVAYIDSYENKVVKLTTIQNAYLFTDDILRQPSSGASGQIVGQVRNDNEIVLKNVVGTFDNTGTFSADIKTFFILLDQKSSYTQGAILSLTDGLNPPVATAEVLNTTAQQNVVEIKVLSGDWLLFNDPDVDYFLQSNNFFNTSGTRAVVLTSLSDNLEPFEVNQSVALVETDENHGLGIGDKVNISIFPDDAIKTKTYFLKKRLYQEVVFKAPFYNSKVEDTRIGRFQILNGGFDYAPGTYQDVPLTGGTGSGATATIVVSDAGIVSSVTIQEQGSGYRKADYLEVDDESLQRSVVSQSTSRFVMYVDHVGFASGSSEVTLSSTNGLAVGDLITIGEEILEVSEINGKNVVLLRGREGTVDKDHYNNQEVKLYKPRYNFVDGFQIGDSNTSGFIDSYDLETQKAVIVFNYEVQKENAKSLKISTTFFDSSSPSRLVSIASADTTDYKFEFSEDNTIFTKNPNIDIQEFYRYKFDTSDPSLLGTYFDLSPSKNYNIITTEKLTTTELPGTAGSFTEVKFGFGPRIDSNDYSVKKGTDFTNFYYFDKNNIVDSEGSYFKLVTDPLQGEKVVIYVTPNRFVYNVPSAPLWDGSGNILYTSKGQFSVGEINDVKIVNLGANYKKVPTIIGVDPNQSLKAKATVLFDETNLRITGVQIDSRGKNYSVPKIIILDGDGVGAKFSATIENGTIFSINVENPGSGYTYPPVIDIIESDVKSYVDSNTIGIPQSIKIINNGGSYHLDKTISSDYTSKYTVSLTSIDREFKKGEVVVQKVGNTEVSRAVVSEWRVGSNLLKLEKVTGTIRENVSIYGLASFSTAVVKSIFVSSFKEKITSFFDNTGYYSSDRGKLGVSNQKITDSYFYQDYSYVVKSKTPIDQWRELIKSTTHPAGFKLFGQVDIETTAVSEMPAENTKTSTFSIIQLWDPEKNKITVENTKQVITQTIQKVENNRIIQGVGSASASEFDFSESRAFEVRLNLDPTVNPFDGYIDDQGILQGTTTFSLYDDNDNLFTPYSAKNLIITLNGILQEPEVAYTVSGNTIVFSQPPLGPSEKLTGNNLNEVTSYGGSIFYGKYFAFKTDSYNDRYFKKIRNIYQRSGRWLDSANQIERNKSFIVGETIAYALQKYPGLDWSTKTDDYQRDVGHILDAYEHDVRFGGNVKTFDYSLDFVQDNQYDYIADNAPESLDIFKFATNLAKLSVRNWDIIEQGVSYTQGSTEVGVPNSDNLTPGMYLSSGKAFSEGTKVVSINSATSITINNPALETSTSDEVTFYMSGINSGTYYDASNLILANKEYLQVEVSEYVYATFALPVSDKPKCYRDIGYLIDAIVYHLRFGGNQNVVEFGRFYYSNPGYPYGETRTSLKSDLELQAAISAWEYLQYLLIDAMRNNLGVGYTGIIPITDNTISVDPQNPTCAEVESSIESMIQIVKDILNGGTGAVNVVGTNPNKTGYYSDNVVYTNYNIIPDPLLKAQECDDVVSSLDSLYDNIDDNLNRRATIKSLPDYIDGENKTFELYWEDGTAVNTEEDEDLFLTINAVLQRPKYTETYPGEDAYVIDRTSVPNKIIFDVAPIWDQDFGAKSIGEPTAVEKVIGIGVGNYKRLTIDYDLVNGVNKGPFIILDVEDRTVQSIEDSRFVYVFIDGVLQRETYTYTISGPNIYFTIPIKKETKVDIRYLYGKDFGQIIRFYDFNPNKYYAKSSDSLEVTSGLSNLVASIFSNTNEVQAYQTKPDGTYNILGNVLSPVVSGNQLSFSCFGPQCELDVSLPVKFSKSGRYFSYALIDISDYTITYERDDDGRLILSTENNWTGTFYKYSYDYPFDPLTAGSLVKIDGESDFRRIKKLPSKTTSKEQRLQEAVSHTHYGSVDVERYNGPTKGVGLSVVATVENGSVVSLTWNQRSYDPITQPTAYQYYTPPVLNFIPVDGNGGGAIAKVLVSKGQVISVDLIDGGSGYTEAPKVEVARKYSILREKEIGVSLVNVGVQGIRNAGMLSVQAIIDQGDSIFDYFYIIRTSIIFDSVDISDKTITSEVNILRDAGENLSREHISLLRTSFTAADNVQAFTFTESVTEVTAEVQSIQSASSISIEKQITTTVQNVVKNNLISSVNYYATGAYLDVDLDPTDTIVYVADTTKFKPYGYLIIGSEVVRYHRKLSDRFLQVDRGQDFTTPKFWPAGTFIRQLSGLSIAFAGVSDVESDSSLVTMSGGTAGAGTESISTYQILTTEFDNVDISDRTITLELNILRDAGENLSREHISFVRTSFTSIDEIPVFAFTESVTEVTAKVQSIQSVTSNIKSEIVIIPPTSGIADGFPTDIIIDDPLLTREDGIVDLLDDYEVIRRDGTSVFVINNSGLNYIYVGNFIQGNASSGIGNWGQFIDDGVGVSAMSIEQVQNYFPTLTLGDLTDRALSTFTSLGEYFNLGNHSIQNAVAVYRQTTDNFGTHGYLDFSPIQGNLTIEVYSNINYFPETGYLFFRGPSGQYSICYYGSKDNNAKTFTDIEYLRGNATTLPADTTEVIPYSID